MLSMNSKNKKIYIIILNFYYCIKIFSIELNNTVVIKCGKWLIGFIYELFLFVNCIYLKPVINNKYNRVSPYLKNIKLFYVSLMI